MRDRNHYLACAVECEIAARSAGPEEERSLLFMARRFRLLAEHASDSPASAESLDYRGIDAGAAPASREARAAD